MTPLRQQMLDDMTVRGLSPGTQTNYVRALKDWLSFINALQIKFSDREVQAYLVHLSRHRGLTWSSCNVARQGIRFLFRTTLQRADTCLVHRVPKCRKSSPRFSIGYFCTTPKKVYFADYTISFPPSDFLSSS